MSFFFSQSDTKTDSTFRRKGTAKTTSQKSKPGWMLDAARRNIESNAVPGQLDDAENAYTLSLLNKDFSNLPGRGRMDEFIGLAPETFVGSPALKSIASIDPYSSIYTDQLGDFYSDLFSQAAAAGKTGPDTIRGGHAHGAFLGSNLSEKAALDKFREITGLQIQQADTTMRASQLAEVLANMRRGDVMKSAGTVNEGYLRGLGLQAGGAGSLDSRRTAGSAAIQSLDDMFGSTGMLTEDDLRGKGSQNSAHTGWQTGFDLCCWIFLEAYNGELPWHVRRYRDLFAPEESAGRAGYRRMSNWLVPLMRRSRVARLVTNYLMVKPLTAYGAWFFNAEDKRWFGRLMQPIKNGWLAVWRLLGRKE